MSLYPRPSFATSTDSELLLYSVNELSLDLDLLFKVIHPFNRPNLFYEVREAVLSPFSAHSLTLVRRPGLAGPLPLRVQRRAPSPSRRHPHLHHAHSRTRRWSSGGRHHLLPSQKDVR